MADLYRFVLREMEKLTHKNLEGKSRVLVSCPFHDDSTPSLIVTLLSDKGFQPGSYSCFGCGARSRTHGGWNGLAERLNLAKIGKDFIQTEWHGRKIDRNKFLDEHSSIKRLDDLWEEWNVDSPELISNTDEFVWRGITANTLAFVSGYTGRDGWNSPAIFLPLWIGRELVGGVKALYKPTSDGRKYFNSAGEWSRTSGLYPLHVKKSWRRVILVEGPRDALTVLQAGLPALAILGTQSWSAEKRNLLLSRGVEEIWDGFDSDKAGRSVAEQIKEDLKNEVDFRRIKLPSGEDPASMGTKWWINFRRSKWNY